MDGLTAPRPGFPGGTAVSHLTVYDWPTADGLAGGSPHLHTTSSEGYVVVGGRGRLQTLSSEGFGEHRLEPGVVMWFTPGTIHRLVNDGDLEIVVVMQNAGLPETGDAVFTFPDDVLADPARYAEAATLPATLPPSVATASTVDMSEEAIAAAARRRRDLAIEGFTTLRARVHADGPSALSPLYDAAARLVAGRAAQWRRTWTHAVREPVDATDRALDDLAVGQAPHLSAATVHVGDRQEETFRFGMCGRLRTWDVATH